MCATAGVIAVSLVPLLIRAFVTLYPGELPRVVPADIDVPVMIAAIVVCVLTAAVLGIPQAVHARRIQGSRGLDLTRTTVAYREQLVRGGLVAFQVALSFVLIVAGISLVRTLARLNGAETGYDAAGVLTFTVSPSPTQTSGAAALQFYEAVVDTVRELPGVRAAAASVAAPMTTGGWRFGIRPRGSNVDVLVGVNLTTAGYFDALGIRLVEGRLLTPDEQRRGTAVAVVNAPLARLLGGNVVGTHFDYSGTKWQIVGVVEGVRHGRPRDEPAPELIIPWHMAGRRPQSIVVRTAGDPMTLLPAIGARIQAIDATAPVTDPARLEDRLRQALAAERFRAVLLGSLAAIAVGLAVLGAYSVTAYAVARRTREFSIRLALGEGQASVGRRALAAALVPSALGVCAGCAIAISSSRWLESFLYQVRAIDGGTLTASASGLLALALLAGASSARRAATLDPARTLTVE